MNAKRQPQGCRFFIRFRIKLNRFSSHQSYQLWPQFLITTRQKLLLPALPHKKNPLTKSDIKM
ncbi:hypothetical protein C6560_16955 [Enterobacter sp. FS01]|nr:hypothetical protein C6560_16955 [Enterobacter sp. FS01]